MRADSERPIVRTLWHSTDKGRTWTEVPVRAGAPLSGGVSHKPDGWWDDGWGNWYRNTAPLVAAR